MSNLDYYRCPRCAEVVRTRLDLIIHLKNRNACSNDYDNRPRDLLLKEFWHKPDNFKVAQASVLKQRIYSLQSELAQLKQ